MSDFRLRLRELYWRLRAIHRHKWIIIVDFVHDLYNPYIVIETERTCSKCMKHQINLWGNGNLWSDWVTTDLSYEEVMQKLNEPIKGKSK